MEAIIIYIIIPIIAILFGAICIIFTKIKTIEELLKGDVNDKDYQKQIIDHLVNQVFVSDDNTVVYFNIRGGKDIEKLTRDVAVKLISCVKVKEKKEIEIVFDFDDCYKHLLEAVSKLGYVVDETQDGKLNISRREAV